MGALKYIITVESDQPPELMLGQLVGGGKVVSLAVEELPRRVDVAWLLERYNLSRGTLIEKLAQFNQGTGNKCLYDPKEVMPVLDQKITSRSKKRLN